MNRALQPDGVAAPAAAYALAVLSEQPARILHTSGIVPVRADGTVPESLAEQAATVWATLAALVAEAAMAMTDIVSITTYVVAGNDLTTVMAARDSALGGHRASSTLVVVPALAQSAWRMEIALVAAS